MYQSGDGTRVLDIQIDADKAAGQSGEPDSSILFPDNDLLFTADFRRSGSDLLLEGPETTSVIMGYFRGERRANIVTPEGAGLKGETIEILAGPDPPGRYAQVTGAAPGLVPIGRVEKVSGSVTVLRNGIPIDLRLGDTVAKGDVVQTGSSSSLTIKLNDGTVFNLSSSARMVLNDMVYSASSNANSALFTLIQGLIGFVAGQVAKTGDLKVDTPVATLAIRGTAVQTEITAISGTTRFSLLTEPDGRVGSIVLLDKNNPSRIIASMSDARVATLLTPVAGADPLISQIAKTNDEIRTESSFVRDLFQFFSEPSQRRGSSDPEDAPIVPASLPRSIDAFDQRQLAFVPFALERVEIPSLTIAVPISAPAPIRGTAIEDGPVARLGALSTAASNEAPPLVLVPAALPPGVRYLGSSRSFSLDPTHPAYQHLGAGETESVTVEYRLAFSDGSVVPASVTWVINGRNDAPIAGNDRIAGLEENGRTTLAVLPNDRDIDGDAVRVVSWTSPFEGSLSLDDKGNLVFDPGDDFGALSRGETATVSFAYTISDGKGGSDTATVTLQVNGEGAFSSPDQAASDADILDFNGQSASLTIETPTATTASSADLELTISLGSVLQPQMNILYLIDVSVSTSDRYEGDPVGDLNADGRFNTILDAEIATLMALTEKVRGLGFFPEDVSVTIIPFNGSADPTDSGSSSGNGVSAETFSLGQTGDDAIGNYLRNLDASGGTDFADALRAANEQLQNLDQGGEKNILYFLSDGRGQGNFGPELAELNDRYNATISALGFSGAGENALGILNGIDNTDGASLVMSPEEVGASDVGSPLQGGKVADVDLFLNGMEIAGIGREDLIEVGNGWTLSTSVDGLRRLVGDANEVQAVVRFESGEVLTADLTIAGALPRSTDLIL
ncbi:Ig-like domain-containing protein [Microvirga guangxiensis]|uniref:FecR family protein n=1 Tax=Microvirga guangxiensis TaxID=549386 RepID=A0A1G5F224_9HYPH|nr:Ig-like domain-containing protein [Microvirga guangxiensis]SCY32678.1 FecR family protein [Microvirga guangxiensis]